MIQRKSSRVGGLSIMLVRSWIRAWPRGRPVWSLAFQPNHTAIVIGADPHKIDVIPSMGNDQAPSGNTDAQIGRPFMQRAQGFPARRTSPASWQVTSSQMHPVSEGGTAGKGPRVCSDPISSQFGGLCSQGWRKESSPKRSELCADF